MSERIHGIGAALIGTGFIGSVHLAAMRRLGLDLRGALGSSPERGAERAAALGLPSYPTLAALLADDTVQVVHVTSPNHAHYPQVKAILAAGKHVVCEKPLSMTASESAEMVRIAQASGLVAAVCYNIRFYPLNQHAHQMVREGALGDIRFLSGHAHQDWLAKETDWNWRLDPDQGGTLRSVGDIGTHWVDLANFITGLRPSHVLAELATFVSPRRKPAGPVETFGAAQGETQAVDVTTDDAAMILLRYPNGARGVISTSQINFGRKNEFTWDFAGSTASAAWNSERPDELFIGHRDAPNQILPRDFGLMNEAGRTAAVLPPGHVEGFGDTFHALFSQVYADVAAGGRQPQSTYAGFEGRAFRDAVLRSGGGQRPPGRLGRDLRRYP